MNWGKVLQKFFKGFVVGGIGAVTPQLPSIVSGSGDIKQGTLSALVVGILSAVLNFIKHRND